MAKHILLVTDDPNLTELVTARLQTSTCEIVHISAGKEAVENLNVNNLPAVVITSSTLPDMGGADFCKSAKMEPRTKNVPIIVLLTKGESEKPFRDLGIDEFLIKPVKISELLESVSMLSKYGSRKNIPTKPKISVEVIAVVFLIIALSLVSVMIIGVKNLPFGKKSVKQNEKTQSKN